MYISYVRPRLLLWHQWLALPLAVAASAREDVIYQWIRTRCMTYLNDLQHFRTSTVDSSYNLLQHRIGIIILLIIISDASSHLLLYYEPV